MPSLRAVQSLFLVVSLGTSGADPLPDQLFRYRTRGHFRSEKNDTWYHRNGSGSLVPSKRRRDKDDLARLSNLTARTLSLVENTLFMFLSISVLCERTRGNGEMLPGMCSAEKIRLYGDL